MAESMEDVEDRFLRNPEAVKMVEEAIANIDPEYAPMAGDSRVLYHCLGCGSLVVNMARHNQWHENQERRLEDLLIAVVD